MSTEGKPISRPVTRKPGLIRQPAIREDIQTGEKKTFSSKPVAKESESSESEDQQPRGGSEQRSLIDSGGSQKEPVQPLVQGMTKRQAALPNIVPLTLQRAPVLISPKASPKQQPLSKQQPAAKTSAGLDLDLLSTKPMKYAKFLKGNESKTTCFLDVGGTTYVLKAGPANLVMNDHLTNTDLFMRLKIPGVRAPLTKPLTDTFRTALLKQLDTQDPQQKQLSTMLGHFDQISERAPGLTLQDILRPADLQDELLKIVQNQTDENAVLALVDKLGASLQPKTMDERLGTPFLPKLKDPTTRLAAIKDLKAKLAGATNVEILSVLENVVQQGAKATVDNMTSQASKRNAAKPKVIAFAQSDAGAYAVGAIAITDLLDGMDDRIVGGKFNPGNFMFDAAKNEFWCVDNAKDVIYGLSPQANANRWKDLALRALVDEIGQPDNMRDQALPIEQRLYLLAYKLKTNETGDFSRNVTLDANQEISTQAGIKRAVTEMLQKMRALVADKTNGLPSTERNNLQARLDFLDARQKFLDTLSLDAVFSDVPDATDPSFRKKLQRKAGAIFLGRPQDAKVAKTLKLQARDPNTSDDDLRNADKQITRYLAALPDTEDADPRYYKALFAARFELLRRTLVEKTGTLKQLALAGNKAWGDVTPEVIQSRIKDVTGPWRSKLVDLKDKQELQALDSAVSDLVQQLNSNV